MTARVARVYPFLLALVPVLNFAANNPDQYAMRDLALLLAVTVAACGAVYVLAALAARGRAEDRWPSFRTRGCAPS